VSSRFGDGDVSCPSGPVVSLPLIMSFGMCSAIAHMKAENMCCANTSSNGSSEITLREGVRCSDGRSELIFSEEVRPKSML